MRLATRLALVGAAVALAWFAARGAPHEPRRGSLAERMLGPFADLAAAWQWTRFDAAWRAGEEHAAYAHADRALALAPSDPSGWIYLAHHAVYERGSPRLEPSPAARRRWVEVGLDLLARGERAAADPGPVAFRAGVVYLSMAALEDADRPLPISRREAWERAAAAFDRAAAAGQPVAAEAARLSREEAAAAR